MILVTGGTGLVGAHLLYHLLLENDKVKAIHRKNSDLQSVKMVFSYYSEDFETIFKRIEWVEADICDVYLLEKAFINVTEVYHAAALISFDPKDYKLLRKVNIEGTSNIVNLCIDQKIKKLCFVSSIATIEKAVNKTTINEDEDWNLENNNYGYAITKYGAEMEVWRASQEGVEVVIVNPGIILGAGFWKKGPGELFTKINKGLKFYSEGITGYIAVTDVVNIMIQLMKSSLKNERYILVSENRSFKEVFFQIADNLDKKRPSILVTPFMSEIGWRLLKVVSIFTRRPPLLTSHSAKSIQNTYFYSSAKIKKALNYEFEPINQTIQKVCFLYKK
ncbi:MAG: NAD-dependent epimerase/dehydratase family protein [Lutibacter sp.]|uniref:SDR family oxidoreductase n=1 Tax=Lutibacter sp. TaxID=1925666 RepID=UPI0017B8D5F8|nr:SDR family oxidoreductase [Lutibacter sp.]MBT8318314.1 SDR family oxidoreductase [Lutibacter sp.]NNJ59171.1 NAD-dependent epimerase/dehydratase family protein [Lutibacter sp.]